MAFEDLCNSSGLSLTLFSHDHQSKNEYFQLDHRREKKKTSDDQFVNLSLGLCGSDQSSLTFDASKLHGQLKPPAGYNNNHNVLLRQASSISTFSSSTVQRDYRDIASSEEVEIIINKRVCNSKVVSDDQEEGGARKKLRLSKQQALVLEDSFKENTTLNSKQKQALAKRLNLRDRQVEVWFQNRRARTKLKQTEIECELLNKLCKTLRDENRKLEKEVQELKALKREAPLHYRQLFPAAMLSVCATCSAERTAAAALTCQSSTKPLISIQHTNRVLWPPQ